MTNRRRISRKRASRNLTEDQIHYLLNGFSFAGFQPNYGHPRTSVLFDAPFESEAAMHRAWKSNEKFLIAQITELFCRPYAFYRFSKEPRRRLDKYYGLGPNGYGYYETDQGIIDARSAKVTESDEEYLIRLDLLTGAEREALNIKKQGEKL
jgi:hypothetical protein